MAVPTTKPAEKLTSGERPHRLCGSEKPGQRIHTRSTASPKPAPDASTFSAANLNDLRRQLNEAIRPAPSESTLKQILQVAMGGVKASGVFYFRHGINGDLLYSRKIHHTYLVVNDELISRLRQGSNAASLEDQIKVFPLGRQNTLLGLAVPIVNTGDSSDCLCLVVNGSELDKGQVAILNMLGAYLTAWSAGQQSLRSDTEASQAAAILELVGRLQTGTEVRHACQHIANALQAHFRCQRVALGVVEQKSKKCQTQSLSYVGGFDKRTELTRSLDLAMQEAVVRDVRIVWNGSKEPRECSRAHGKAADAIGCSTIVSEPLKNPAGQTVGAWLFMGDDDLATDAQRLNAIAAAAVPLGNVLHLVRMGQRSKMVRVAKRAWNERQSWKGRLSIAAALLVLAVLLLPVPLKVKCQVTLQPVERRFVAAPFNGTLQQTLCEPGDVVSAGQLLAQLDGREIRWELAGLIADRQRAATERQVAMATHDAAAAKQAELRVERLSLRIELLENRQKNLDIRSPTGGIVISGDLQNAVGVPVKTGQTLFEIAPLSRLNAQIAIPDEQIHHISSGQSVKITTDADPSTVFELTVDSIHPAAEVVDGNNVFIGEALLRNDGGNLRPGMAGRAIVIGSRHPIGWNLFHKPWYALVRMLNG